MGLNRYLWDTNIVIYFLQQQFSESAEKFVDDLLKTSVPTISVITEIELLCWNAPSQHDINLIKSFIDKTTVFGLNEDIKQKKVEVRKASRVKLPDAIIAATALHQNLSLVTRNSKDFKHIDGLKILNPYKQ